MGPRISGTEKQIGGDPAKRPAAPRGPSRANVWRMFDRIAGRYDLLNRLLSARRDVAWRNRLIRRLPHTSGLCLLDLATGTGDVLIAALKQRNDLTRVVGLDMAPTMLRLAADKLAMSRMSDRASLVRADAEALPFAEGSFDIATIAFGIRNMSDTVQALREMRRVLAPGGLALILEFSMPRNRLARRFYPFYLRGLLPRLGGLISGDRRAYRYLNETVETFAYGSEFLGLMADVGFVEVTAEPLTLGIASVYRGVKPQEM